MRSFTLTLLLQIVNCKYALTFRKRYRCMLIYHGLFVIMVILRCYPQPPEPVLASGRMVQINLDYVDVP